MLTELLASWHFTPFQWGLAALCGLAIGISKTGLVGTMFWVVPIMAGMFGAMESTGVVLPMLVVADVFAVTYYHRHADWKHLARLLPFSLLGILVAVGIGGMVSKKVFEIIFTVTIFLAIGLMLWREAQHRELPVPKGKGFAAGMGFAGGFTTMIGNAAGPVMSLYLLAMKLPKAAFIGTTAWFYCIVNVIKLPLQVLVWKNITVATLAFDLATVPFIFLGVWVGIAVVKRIPERGYRMLIMATVVLAALLMVAKLFY